MPPTAPVAEGRAGRAGGAGGDPGELCVVSELGTSCLGSLESPAAAEEAAARRERAWHGPIARRLAGPDLDLASGPGPDPNRGQVGRQAGPGRAEAAAVHADARPKLAIAAEGPGLLILSATEARDALARAAPASTSWSARLPTPAPDAHLDELALAVLYIFLVCI